MIERAFAIKNVYLKTFQYTTIFRYKTQLFLNAYRDTTATLWRPYRDLCPSRVRM